MKHIILILTIMLTYTFAGDGFPITEQNWLIEATKDDGYNSDIQRKVALMIKVIHIRLDKMANEIQANKTTPPEMSKLMNSLHTHKWWIKTSDKQSEDMYAMLQNLYIQLLAIDKAISDNTSTSKSNAPKNNLRETDWRGNWREKF